MPAADWISTALGVVALVGAFFGVVRWSLAIQRVALEKARELERRLDMQELKSITGPQLDAALAKLLLQIERRMDGLESGLKSATSEVHQMRIELAVLKDREGVPDYSDHNRKLMEAARRG
jgi:hypothetical protein